MVRTVALAVALACAAFASPALGQEFVEVKGKVSRAGLDLSDPSDAAEFNRRVARTARYICRRGVPKELQYSSLVNECRASVVANGKRQLTSLAGKSRPEHRLAQGD